MSVMVKWPEGWREGTVEVHRRDIMMVYVPVDSRSYKVNWKNEKWYPQVPVDIPTSPPREELDVFSKPPVVIHTQLDPSISLSPVNPLNNAHIELESFLQERKNSRITIANSEEISLGDYDENGS